jgi:hypothetical protein
MEPRSTLSRLLRFRLRSLLVVLAFLGLLSTAILQTIKLERAGSREARTTDAIRQAWWAIPVAGVAVATYIICRALRQTPARLGAMVGCLVGAFIPGPRVYAQYHDAEAAYMGVLYETLYHTLWCSFWGSLVGGVIAAIAWTQWVHHARKRFLLPAEPPGPK